MHSPQLFQIEWHQTSWFVLDPVNESVKVPIDSAVVDAVKARPGCVTGYIRAVHGLDMEIAKKMNRTDLMNLGVQTLRMPPASRSYERIQLEAGGGYSAGQG